ncbi:MAG: PDZ domain-containing protein [Planctomycetes bacterium]|nr:PDZ domain-containing protein [Planctomycetota bacterium]
MFSAATAICAALVLLQDPPLPPLPDGSPPADAQGRAAELTRTDYDRQFPRWLAQGRIEDALRIAEQYLETHPDDPQVLFDACRASALLGDGRSSAALALRALRAGWVDDRALDEHPDLARLRAHDGWQRVIALRTELRGKEPPPPPADEPTDTDASGESTARSSLAQWMRRFGGGRYRVDEDKPMGLLIASALEPDSVRRTRTSLQLLSNQLTTHFFEQRQPDTVLLVLIAPEHAKKIFDDPRQGGIYQHHLRQLLACSTGAILRHEYTHLLHRGHMQRLGQRHPIWMLEGFGTLFEDWTVGAASGIVILPNHRTAETFDRVKKGVHTPWRDFMALSDGEFMKEPRWNYAQARSMLAFLAHHGQLASWYRAYTDGYTDDPSGLRAVERVMRAPIAAIEGQWRDWVLQRGRQDGTVEGGEGVLGTTLANRPEGVRIDAVAAGGPAQRAGLARGDFLLAIDGEEIRSVGDYLMALAGRQSGENVEVRFRRGQVNGTVQVNLAAGRTVTP